MFEPRVIFVIKIIMLNELEEFYWKFLLGFTLFSIMTFLSTDKASAKALLLFSLFDEAIFLAFIWFPGPLFLFSFARIARAHFICMLAPKFVRFRNTVFLQREFLNLLHVLSQVL